MSLPRSAPAARLWRVDELLPYLERREKLADEFSDGDCAVDRHVLERMSWSRAATAAELFDELAELHLASVSAGALSLLARPAAVLAQRPSLFNWMDSEGQIHETDNPEGIDSAEEFSPEHPEGAEVAADVSERLSRDSEYIFHVRNRAGEVIPAENYEKQRALRAELEAQGMEIALALELCWKRRARAEAEAKGEPFDEANAPSAFDRAAQKRKPVIVDPVGRRVLSIVPYRRVNFNPVCAAVRRAPMLKHLEGFLTDHPLAKMFTFTNGPRVRLSVVGEIRAAIMDQHRRLSKLNADPRFRDFGCSLAFRATELGELRRLGDSAQVELEGIDGGRPGEITAHVHSHVFAVFKRALPPGAFALFVKTVWEIWGTHWDYGRTVESAREACKYPVKPSDMKEANMTPEEVDRLYQELFKLRLVTPLSTLKKKIRFRRNLALKGLKRRTDKGDLALKFRPDWNARGQRAQMVELESRGVWVDARDTKARTAADLRRASLERFFYAAALLSELGADEAENEVLRAWALWLAWSAPKNEAERARAAKKQAKELARALSTAPAPENQIVARLAPAPYFDRVTRPALLVWNFDGDWEKLERQQVCAELVSVARPLVEAGLQDMQNEARVLEAPNTQCSHQSRNCPELFCEESLTEKGEILAQSLTEKGEES